MAKAAKKPDKPILDVSKNRKGELKNLGGSMSNGWNQVICNQVGNSLTPRDDEEHRDEAWIAALQAMNGIAPKDELEGMLAAQLVASHSASMDCYRRAMNSQTLEWRREHLNQANKLSRTYTTLLESLNRHRGKGQQKVTVEPSIATLACVSRPIVRQSATNRARTCRIARPLSLRKSAIVL